VKRVSKHCHIGNVRKPLKSVIAQNKYELLSPASLSSLVRCLQVRPQPTFQAPGFTCCKHYAWQKGLPKTIPTAYASSLVKKVSKHCHTGNVRKPLKSVIARNKYECLSRASLSSLV
jgi:hypothetical protein